METRGSRPEVIGYALNLWNLRHLDRHPDEPPAGDQLESADPKQLSKFDPLDATI